MVYIPEGFEEQAAKVIVAELNALANRVSNNMVHYRPSYAPQAIVRQSGWKLRGAIDLAVSALGRMGQRLPDDLHQKANEIANNAVEFKAANAVR